MSTKPLVKYTVAARGSPLSRRQVEEVRRELVAKVPHVDLEPLWVETGGDRDLCTSLRTLGRTDFFTREIDELLLQGVCRLAIHSAKDLPEPLAKGLVLVALTQGLDPSDSLVLREGESLKSLRSGAKIATSSLRREKMIRELREDLVCVDVRGTIERRLSFLDLGEVDGLVVAECALIRLRFTHRNRIFLPGEGAPLQGRLAVVAAEKDLEMLQLLKCLNFRST